MVLTNLHTAAGWGYFEQVRTLSRLHPGWVTERISDGGFMPLHLAASAGRPQCVSALLEAGAPRDAHTPDHTPLMLACISDYKETTECVRILLAAGADITAAAHSSGNTALHLAASHGHVSVLRTLLDAAREAGLLPVVVQARNRHGETPFHCAATTGSTACMAALLACGSDIHAVTAADPDDAGARTVTALHLAAVAGETEAVQLLAALAPALVTARSGDGSTPLDFARDRNQLEAARCLEQRVPTAAALSVLADAGPPALPLFAQLLASRWPLTAEDWELMPAPCPGLGTLLPRAVQESDEQQAALLVRHLAHADRQRLRASALGLALGRDGQHEPLPRLPAEIVRHILALSPA